MQQEMEAAARARDAERTAEQRTTMERMLMRSMQQLGGGGNAGGANAGANGFGLHDQISNIRLRNSDRVAADQATLLFIC